MVVLHPVVLSTERHPYPRSARRRFILYSNPRRGIPTTRTRITEVATGPSSATQESLPLWFDCGAAEPASHSLHSAVGTALALRPLPHACGVDAGHRQRHRSFPLLRSHCNSRPDAYRCSAVPTGAVTDNVATGRTAFLTISLSYSPTWQLPGFRVPANRPWANCAFPHLPKPAFHAQCPTQGVVYPASGSKAAFPTAFPSDSPLIAASRVPVPAE